MRAFASLRRPVDFSRLRQRGRRVAMDAFTLFSDSSRADPLSVVGISVSKAVGIAVTRNRVRRRFAALLHETLTGRPPRRLLIVARPAAAQVSFATLRDQLRAALG